MFIKHIWALTIKRFHHTKRNKKGFIFEVIYILKSFEIPQNDFNINLYLVNNTKIIEPFFLFCVFVDFTSCNICIVCTIGYATCTISETTEGFRNASMALATPTKEVRR